MNMKVVKKCGGVAVCVCALLSFAAAVEGVLITAASIWWGGEFVFVPSRAGCECVAAEGGLLSEWMEPG